MLNSSVRKGCSRPGVQWQLRFQPSAWAQEYCQTLQVSERSGVAYFDAPDFSRRRFLRAVAVAAAPVAFLARVQTLLGSASDTIELAPTPAVGEQLELTPQETAGPFFRAAPPPQG